MRHFREEEVVAVGHLLAHALVGAHLLDLLGSEHVNAAGLGLLRGFTGSEHRDLDLLSTTGGKTDLFLDTVVRVLEVDVLDGERELNRFDKGALRRLVQGFVDGGGDVVFHDASPLRSARRQAPLPHFVNLFS